MRRRVYDLSWSETNGRWELWERSSSWAERTYTGLTKKTALKMARALCREWYKAGELVQLIVRGKDHRILFENTYGQDPMEREG